MQGQTRYSPIPYRITDRNKRKAIEIYQTREVLLRRQRLSSLASYFQTSVTYRLRSWQNVLCSILDQAATERGQRILLHVPPQYGKSVIVSQRFPAYLIERDPLHRVRLACYNETKSIAHGSVVQSLLSESTNEKVKVSIRDSTKAFYTPARAELRDSQPSFLALGLLTGFTGQGADTLIIDDPYKSPEEARSATINDKLYRFWSETAQPRISDDTNVVVMFHRYNMNDLAGRLIKDGGFTEYRFAALCDDPANDPMGRSEGEALLPEKHTAEQLAEIRGKNPYMFAGQFQGKPVAEGSNIFRGVTYYEALPQDGYAVVIGLDLAYSAKTRADWSVIVVGRMVGDVLYITDVIRMQAAIDSIAVELKAQRALYPRAPMAMAIGGQEKAVVDLLNGTHRLRIKTVPATADKVVRSTQTASAWNAGKIRVPENATWLESFLNVILAFAGVNDAVDDDVDALANCYNEGINRYNFLKGIT